MKKIAVKNLLFCTAFLCCFNGCVVSKKAFLKKYPVTITNPSTIERADELVVLTRQMIEQRTGSLGSNFINITSRTNQPVSIQFDDLNKDGKWDEAAFLYSFHPNEAVHFLLNKSELKTGNAVARAHVRMRKKNQDQTFGPLLDSVTVPRNTAPTDFTKQKLPPYLTEGPAWENDKVAFRLYMDVRNTKDIYGKITPKMMMDTVGVIPENSYHNMADWGMDILAVGKSLGAGSLALKLPLENNKDTLVRLGGENVERTTFEKIADGPLRAIFSMHYKNWKALPNIAPIDITEEISIWGGKYYYQSKIKVTNAPQGAELITGIVNLKSKRAVQIDTANSKVLYSYDVQSENKDYLGLAVAVRNSNFLAFGKTPNAGSDVLNTYTVSMPVNSQPAEYRFFAGWERSDLLFTKEESFKKFLENEAIKYGRNLIIEFK